MRWERLGLALVLGCQTAVVRPDSAISLDPVRRSRTAEGAQQARERQEATLISLESNDRFIQVHPLAKQLSCGLYHPMPGGHMAGYPLDTGLDIASLPREVFAIASGRIVYAEVGHTAWNSRHDSPWAVLIELDEPISFEERQITHFWYAHMSSIVPDLVGTHTVHVAAGALLGVSGKANGSYHLHLGMLLDGNTSQSHGTFLNEKAIRQVLCSAPSRGVLRAP